MRFFTENGNRGIRNTKILVKVDRGWPKVWKGSPFDSIPGAAYMLCALYQPLILEKLLRNRRDEKSCHFNTIVG